MSRCTWNRKKGACKGCAEFWAGKPCPTNKLAVRRRVA